MTASRLSDRLAPLPSSRGVETLLVTVRSGGADFKRHSSYEAQHNWWRDRYKVAADDLGVRSKIRDIAWHRLRANVAGLVAWLRICYREGWLGKPRRNHLGTERKFRNCANAIANTLATMRLRMGIMGAYGEWPRNSGWASENPPTRPRHARRLSPPTT